MDKFLFNLLYSYRIKELFRVVVKTNLLLEIKVKNSTDRFWLAGYDSDRVYLINLSDCWRVYSYSYKELERISFEESLKVMDLLNDWIESGWFAAFVRMVNMIRRPLANSRAQSLVTVEIPCGGSSLRMSAHYPQAKSAFGLSKTKWVDAIELRTGPDHWSRYPMHFVCNVDGKETDNPLLKVISNITPII